MWKIEKYVTIKSLKQTIRIKKSANICEGLLHDLPISSLNYLKSEKINKFSDKFLCKNKKKSKLTPVVSCENRNTKLWNHWCNN